MEIENQEEYNNNNQNQEEEFNQIFLCLNFFFTKNIREVAAGILDINQRLFYLAEFQDNEHYSNFESLLVQVNPQNSFTKFTVLVNYPSLSTEREKVEDIIKQCEFDTIEKKSSDFDEKKYKVEVINLLDKNVNFYINEIKLERALAALACGCSHLNLVNEVTNQKQFKLKVYNLQQYMKLDLAALIALSIFPKNYEQNQAKNEFSEYANSFASLIDLLDKCRTQIGSRCLRRWIKQPLQDVDEINKRLDIVQVLFDDPNLLLHIQNTFLRKIPDLDKLYSKFYKVNSQKKNHQCGLVDCIKVYQVVRNIKELVTFLDHNNNNIDESSTFIKEFIEPLRQCLKDFDKLEMMVEKAIDLQQAQKGEYMINSQFNTKLQQIHAEMNKYQNQINNIKDAVQEDLGVEIKLVDSQTYTYLFEVNKKKGDEAMRQSSKRYQNVATKKGQISFTTDRLKEQIVLLKVAKEQYMQEQSTVVGKILKVVATYYPAMEKASDFISQLDVLCSFTNISYNAPTPYVKPIFSKDNKNIILKKSRHPTLEMSDQNKCIPNDCEMLEEEAKLHIITGPNMGGKSTYIRQVAITCLLGHIGCFVPAQHAEIPIIDAIVTRVGASDMQLRGISTFMSEMLEASCMMKVCSEKSLVIIDELGRGTSTSEGFGLAWGIAEYMSQVLKSYCLFATHFHELTMMEKQVPKVKNFHASAIIQDNQLNMLYQIKEGPADRSYGLFVAQILNFPQKILDDAQRKVKDLEDFESQVDLNQSNNIQNQGGEQMEIEINSKQNLDLKELAKFATQNKKQQVINLVEKYKIKLSEQLEQQLDPKKKLEILREIQQQVKHILSN